MSEHKLRERQITALEDRVRQLEEISDNNARTFSDSLKIAELCIQALQRALDDVLDESPKTIEVGGKRKIDFKGYTRDAIDAFEQMRAAQQPSDEEEESDTYMIEFGG